MSAIQKPHDLIFDAQAHKYYVGGIEIPSVTQCIREAGLMETAFYTELGRWRGSAVHLACRYEDEKDLDFDGLDEALKPYVRAYAEFKSDYEFEPTEIEVPRYNPVHGYCGTPDRVGSALLRGKPVSVVVDLKIGGSVPCYALQLAGYAALLDNPRQYLRLKVQLKKDATYAVHEYSTGTFAADLNVFLSAVVITHWKRRELSCSIKC